MTFPNHIFIDTAIFDSQKYNFSSREFTAFLNRFPPSENTLLLPIITSNEICKHIRMRVDEVVNIINKLQKRLPRIKTLQGWPLSENSKEQLIEGLIKIEEDAFNSFINKFNLIEIDLNDVSLESVR